MVTAEEFILMETILMAHQTCHTLEQDKYIVIQTTTEERKDMLSLQWTFAQTLRTLMKNLQKKIKHGKLDVSEDDPFELFVASTTIR